MNITDLTQPMRDEKSRAYRVPVEAEWFQERDCVVIEPFPVSPADRGLIEARLWTERMAQSL